MWHRIPVIISGLALAVVSAFLWAPHVHLHADQGLRHAHLTPHDHQGPHDPAHHQDGDDDETILDADAFVSTAAWKMVPPPPARTPELPASIVTVVNGALILPDQPRAHGPPRRDLTAPRAPPASSLTF
jgi:hypothetical protein